MSSELRTCPTILRWCPSLTAIATMAQRQKIEAVITLPNGQIHNVDEVLSSPSANNHVIYAPVGSVITWRVVTIDNWGRTTDSVSHTFTVSEDLPPSPAVDLGAEVTRKGDGRIEQTTIATSGRLVATASSAGDTSPSPGESTTTPPPTDGPVVEDAPAADGNNPSTESAASTAPTVDPAVGTPPTPTPPGVGIQGPGSRPGQRQTGGRPTPPK